MSDQSFSICPTRVNITIMKIIYIGLVVLLAAGHLAAASLGQLRDELGLEHDLVDVLTNWAGLEPGFLIIDALDAARADPSAHSLRQLMRLVLHSCPRLVVHHPS